MIRKYALLACMFLSVYGAACGQSVGLVLSGGGAKGLYHIGVIKALEENDIPIDYITGTSIGAIVGGLYAIGYSPERMEEVFTSSELRYWISGTIEDKYKYYFKQMDRTPEAFTFRVDFKEKRNKAKLPSNIIPSDQLDMAFADFFAPATAYTGGDFDRLFVPFRCIATDVTNRREKVFSHGDIGKAVRASMAIPFVFTPMKIDSAVLYDGGMFNNFPFSTMQHDFKPDFMIGCSVSSPDKSSDRQSSLIEQAMKITMLHSDYDMPEENAIIIKRHFDDVSTMDFDRARYIIDRGYEDAMRSMDSIKARIGRRVPAGDVARRRAAFNDKLVPVVFESFDIEGLTKSQEGYVRRILRIDDDEPFTFDEFRNEYFKILSEGEIKGEYPEIEFDHSTGKYRLSMKMSIKPSFKIMLGGNVSSTALNQAFVGLEYSEIGNSARRYYVRGALSPFYTSFNPGARIDFFIRSPFFAEAELVTNYYNYFRSNYGFLSKNNDLTYLKKEDNYFSMAFGLPVERQSVLSLRGNIGQANYRYNSAVDEADTLDRTRFRYISGKIELERKNTNHSSYATRGIYQAISIMAVTGKERYFPGSEGRIYGIEADEKRRMWLGARFTREHYFPVKPIKWLSWGYLIDAVATTHPTFMNERAGNFTSPGFTPTPHSRIVYLNEFRNDIYVAGGLMPTIEFGPNFYLKNSFYAYVPIGNKSGAVAANKKVRYIFDASLVFRTVAGPISLSISKYDVKRNNWFITFNFGTTIFNNKGTFY